LVIADGPRPERNGEAEKCAAARAIIDRVDWECEVRKNYSDVNLGCGWREATGMIWIFEQVNDAIILEDDTLPHPTFFRFCEELLEKYRDDKRVMHISGDNWLYNQKETSDSYFFSRYCLSWGWASWRRAFELYDPEIKLWPSLRHTTWLLDTLRDPRAVDHWTRIFDATYAGMENVDTWDFQWLFTIWAHHGLSILPNTNLISNLGFNRADAAHTTGGASDRRNKLATAEMIFPLKHPTYMVPDGTADQIMFDQTIHPLKPLTVDQRLRRHLVNALPTPLRRSIASVRSQLFRIASQRPS
jgi:hypothetical protein